MDNAASVKPLFPKPIPVIGCCGEFASGKTHFLVSIDPKHTRIYDFEKSSESYAELGFERVDVPLQMSRRYPNGYKPQQTFEWWRGHVRQIKPGQFRVIAIDPISDIESGLVEWVRNNPTFFGHTPAQYIRMSGLMWGDVKELWKSLLADLASRCEVFAFSVHMGEAWSGDRPTGKRKPKGKSTLMELASLYLELERKPDTKGNVPDKPSAIVRKSRLSVSVIDADGEVISSPVLPPRLPVATPAAIRKYFVNLPDYSKLKPGELAPEQTMSEDDRAAVRLATAEAERETEQFRLEKIQRQQESERLAASRSQATKPPSPPAQIEPTNNDSPRPTEGKADPAASPSTKPARQTASFSAHAITDEQFHALAELRSALFAGAMADATDEEKKTAWIAILAKRKVNTARALTRAQADELIARLRTQLDIREMEASVKPPPAKGGEADSAAAGG